MGRVFRSDAIDDHRSEGHKIRESTYVGRLGGHGDFKFLMENELKKCKGLGSRLVYVTDSAPWIRNWITAAYPKAKQILDFYHAVEHLGKLGEHIKSELPKD